MRGPACCCMHGTRMLTPLFPRSFQRVCAVEISKKRKAKEAAAAAAPPAIASAPPPRVAPTIASAPAPFPLPVPGRPPPYGMPPAPYGVMPPHMEGPALPHKILFVQARDERARHAPPAERPAADARAPVRFVCVQGLPEKVEAGVLKALFTQFPGFREVRLIEARPGISFVEFDNEMQAGAALAGLQAFKVDDAHTMQITYAKR